MSSVFMSCLHYFAFLKKISLMLRTNHAIMKMVQHKNHVVFTKFFRRHGFFMPNDYMIRTRLVIYGAMQITPKFSGLQQ